jgi:dTDP-glucose pyrophosphorylase
MKLNVIIPMAGLGSRFSNEGYSLPKHLIPVIDKPMIHSVIENLNLDANWIFIIRNDLDNKVKELLKQLKPDSKIIEISEVTDGPARTTLLAKDYINDDPLVIINCDQMVHDFDITKLIEFSNVRNADGILGSFISTSDKCSFVKLNDDGDIIDVKEKIVISNIATTGLHFWKNGLDFVSSAEEMIESKEMYNNEFYIAPSYNYLIKNGKRVLPFFYNLHFPIGTPNDLKIYQELYGNS